MDNHTKISVNIKIHVYQYMLLYIVRVCSITIANRVSPTVSGFVDFRINSLLIWVHESFIFSVKRTRNKGDLGCIHIKCSLSNIRVSPSGIVPSTQ